MQRLEDLVSAVVNDVYTQEEAFLDDYWRTRQSGEAMLSTDNYTIPSVKSFCQKNVFLQKARNEALTTLQSTASSLEKTNPEAARRISDMTEALDVSRGLDASHTLAMFEQIESFYGKILETVALRPSYREDGLKRVKEMNQEISEYLDVSKAFQEPLSKKDYDALKELVKGRPVEGLVEHRSKQILFADRQKTLAAENGRG